MRLDLLQWASGGGTNNHPMCMFSLLKFTVVEYLNLDTGHGACLTSSWYSRFVDSPRKALFLLGVVGGKKK